MTMPAPEGNLDQSITCLLRPSSLEQDQSAHKHAVDTSGITSPEAKLLFSVVGITVLACILTFIYTSGMADPLIESIAKAYFKAEAKAEEKALEKAGSEQAEGFLKGQQQQVQDTRVRSERKSLTWVALHRPNQEEPHGE